MKFEMKAFFREMNLKYARTMFSIKTKMTRTIKSHFSNDKKYAAMLWKCSVKCSQVSSLEHTLMCKEYKYLRENRDLYKSDLDLVHYIQDVLEVRDNIEE